ncbi:ABC1 kinase family protein [Paenibacillus humicola]|uniref:ABC1 kinase family protein n=1 Tax=Paenibacillus humicola TaxID=3110540 RepID=UPI00237BD1B6|nr:AarF/ABC1/UbiB kinase family protein [Paenibacillus humicola]
MFGKRIRHMNRYREIALSLIRHGFGYIVEEMDVFHMLSVPRRLFPESGRFERKTVGERIRSVTQDLGPAFVKLGQIASTRPDLIPEDIIKELEKLQDQVDPFPFDEVRQIIESELKAPMDTLFAAFEETPLAAASIGQVHFAILDSGERVAVKIQRPSIAETIRTDLEILENLASIAERRFDWASRYQAQSMIAEFAKALLAELDYTIEGKNAERIARQFEGDPHLFIPKVYWRHSSRKVLVMEFITGIKLSRLDDLESGGYDRKLLAERFINSVFHQIFVEGFFHADPHPGNLLALPGETVAFLDFGMVGRLTPEMKTDLSALVIALMRQRTEGIMQAVLQLGLVDDDANVAELRRDIEFLREKYYDVPLHDISLGEAVTDLFDAAYRHRVRIPADFILLGKTLLIAEGVVERLDPELSIVQMAEPFGRRLLIERFHPKQVKDSLWKDVLEYGDLLVTFPRQMKELLAMVKKGRLRLEIGVPELERFLRNMDRIGNRLSFSIVLLSFSIIMTGLIIGSSLERQPSFVWNIPAIEIGFFVATAMFVWLLYSIFKSGRF